MFYRLRRAINTRRLDRALSGILATPALTLTPGPASIVSMVADGDVLMYLTAIKALYPKIGGGEVIAIVARTMSGSARDLLAAHVPGIRLLFIEDLDTGPCQRGGCWERLLFCLTLSATRYVVQMDCDTLAVGADVAEIVRCIADNRSFTMCDGFARMTVPEAVALAEATPSDYIGMIVERAFAQLPDAARLHYVRGSAGFAGFARGGFPRAEMEAFHGRMEGLVGAKPWRIWGTEQCASNFAVANSPNPMVLPYPQYASFTPRLLLHEVKLFHFIGRFRFRQGYYARRAREVIARLTPGAAVPAPPPPVDLTTGDDGLPLLFSRSLQRESLPRFLRWKLAGGRTPITVQMKPRREFRNEPGPGPRFELRGHDAANTDRGVAYEVFVHLYYAPPVWIPAERVSLVVDLGANVGMSCLWWLSNYWNARVVAYEPHAGHAAQARRNIALNGYEPRITLYECAAGVADGSATLSDDGAASTLTESGTLTVRVVDILRDLAGQRVDILKLDIEGSEVAIFDDPRFAELDIGAIAMEWHAADGHGRGGRDWCVARLRAAGYATYVTSDLGAQGILWAYRG